MPCVIQILNVNGATPAGAAGPTQIRVIGSTSGCPGNSVTVTAAGTSQTVPADPVSGRFVAVLAITAGSVPCGSTLAVTASCGAGCQDSSNVPLACCEIPIVTITGLVPVGTLTPTVLRVAGVALGCFNNAVDISSPTGTVATHTGVPVDAQGNFSVDMPIIISALCDDKVDVTISCGAGCQRRVSNKIACIDCARAQVSAAVTLPCTGTPPSATVSLDATIEIAAGAKEFFQWHEGVVARGAVFQIDNTGGGANTPHAHSEVVTFSAGAHSLELCASGATGNCKEGCVRIPLSFNVNCSGCPITVTITADPPGPCVGGTRSVTFHATVSGVPSGGAALQWHFPGSTTVSTSAFPVTTNGPIPDQTIQYPASTTGNTSYTASIDIVLPAGCTTITFPVSIPPCPACCPTVTVSATASGCAPTNASATFTATMGAVPAGCSAPTPTSFQWTLDGPTNKKYQLTTTTPSASTSVQWTESSTGLPAAVQFPVGGSYSVSVTAVFAAGAVAASCQPATDTKSFAVNACCPQLIGPLNASPKPGDPCTWLFSAQVSNPSGATVSYQWTFHDGTTATTTVPQAEHTYPLGGGTTGTTTVTLKSPGCPDQTLSATITVLCFPTGTTTPPPTTPPPTTAPPGSGGCLCTILLWTAFAFVVISAIAVIIAFCVPAVVVIFAIIAVVAFVIAIILFILWVVLCGSAPGACGALLTLDCLLVWLIAITWIVAIIVGIFTNLLCGLGVLVTEADWGLFLAAVTTAEAALGCRRINCFVPRGGGPFGP